MSGPVYDLRAGEAALQAGNKTALYAGILDVCGGMRDKLQLLKTGQLKRAVSVFRDPNYPKKQLRVIQQVEDGRLRTTYWMDDSNIWAHCAERRRQFDEYRRHAATTGTQHMFREYFMSTWLLETYILLKYGIDLRNSEWADPSAPDFRKVNWIMDNDSFASRYKLTTYSESRGVANPFDGIKVEMTGLDLSKILNTNNKETAHEHTSSVAQPPSTTEFDRPNTSNQVQSECSQQPNHQ